MEGGGLEAALGGPTSSSHPLYKEAQGGSPHSSLEFSLPLILTCVCSRVGILYTIRMSSLSSESSTSAALLDQSPRDVNTPKEC
jgi:hypothetical protein